MSALPPPLQLELRSLTAHVLDLRHTGTPPDQIRDYVDDAGARLMNIGLQPAAMGTLVSCLAAIRALAG